MFILFSILAFTLILAVIVSVKIVPRLKCSSSLQKTGLNTNIPFVLYMCAKTKSDIPSKVQKRWQSLNTNLEIEISSDRDCREFLSKHFGEDYVSCFNYIKFGPIRADFWRVCKLYIHGGYYSDIDIVPKQSLKKICSTVANFVTSLTFRNDSIFQAFIAATPKHNVLERCIDRYMNRWRNRTPMKYWEWSGTHDMYKEIVNELGVSNGEVKSGLFLDKKIMLLQEKCHGSFQSCGVKLVDDPTLKYLFLSRDPDYDMEKHKFL